MRDQSLSYDTNAASDESGLECKDPSLAVQSSKDEADINFIIRNFGLEPTVPAGLTLPTYGDFTGIDSYQEAVQAIAKAKETFELLPAPLRNRFQNEPELFVAFCSDEANRPEMEALGLLKEKPAAVVPVPVSLVGGEPPTPPATPNGVT